MMMKRYCHIRSQLSCCVIAIFVLINCSAVAQERPHESAPARSSQQAPPGQHNKSLQQHAAPARAANNQHSAQHASPGRHGQPHSGAPGQLQRNSAARKPSVQPQAKQHAAQPQATAHATRVPRTRSHTNAHGNNRAAINHRPAGWSVSRPAYTHAPHVYGGHRYYSYYNYYNHPYQPFVYGPSWHPVGFFLTALPAAAIVIAFNNVEYRYDDGVYYQPGNNGYQAVAPPVGAYIPSLPAGYATTEVGGIDYYYYGGVFYAATQDGYQIVRAPAGAIVYNLPEGCQQVQAGDIVYLQYGNSFFQPIQFNGQDAYEVVDME